MMERLGDIGVDTDAITILAGEGGTSSYYDRLIIVDCYLIIIDITRGMVEVTGEVGLIEMRDSGGNDPQRVVVEIMTRDQTRAQQQERGQEEEEVEEVGLD